MKHGYLDQYSDTAGVLQRIEPRIKIVSLFTFVIVIMSAPVLPAAGAEANAYTAFCLFGIIICSMLILSRVSLAYVVKKSLVIMPFVLMAAACIPFSRRPDAMTLFWGVVIKSYLAMLCMVLLTATTPFAALLKAFEQLKVPRPVILVFSFMYRYIFVIEDEFMQMHQAKESRACAIGFKQNAQALSNMLGMLFVRSYERAESVYLAMVSRGFDGNIRTLRDTRIRALDIAFAALLIMLLMGIRFFL